MTSSSGAAPGWTVREGAFGHAESGPFCLHVRKRKQQCGLGLFELLIRGNTLDGELSHPLCLAPLLLEFRARLGETRLGGVETLAQIADFIEQRLNVLAAGGSHAQQVAVLRGRQTRRGECHALRIGIERDGIALQGIGVEPDAAGVDVERPLPVVAGHHADGGGRRLVAERERAALAVGLTCLEARAIDRVAEFAEAAGYARAEVFNARLELGIEDEAAVAVAGAVVLALPATLLGTGHHHTVRRGPGHAPGGRRLKVPFTLARKNCKRDLRNDAG